MAVVPKSLFFGKTPLEPPKVQEGLVHGCSTQVTTLFIFYKQRMKLTTSFRIWTSHSRCLCWLLKFQKSL